MREYVQPKQSVFFRGSPAVCKPHFGKLVLVESQPIELAKIPVSGESLHQCILIHPRYVPRGMPHDIVSVRGYRNQYNLEVLLDKPLEIDGKQYGVLNFKGAGENADIPLAIRPGMGYDNYGWYRYTEDCGSLSKLMWGGLTRRQARAEFASDVLTKLSLPLPLPVSLNDIPSKVVRQILEVHGCPPARLGLSQTVRALSTNLRLKDIPEDAGEFVDPLLLASVDARLIETQAALAKKGKMVTGIEFMQKPGRLVDGTFMDSGNHQVGKFDLEAAAGFLATTVRESFKNLSLFPALLDSYRAAMKALTGLPVAAGHFQNTPGDFHLMKYALGDRSPDVKQSTRML